MVVSVKEKERNSSGGNHKNESTECLVHLDIKPPCPAFGVWHHDPVDFVDLKRRLPLEAGT
jgi:hypothetical protein